MAAIAQTPSLQRCNNDCKCTRVYEIRSKQSPSSVETAKKTARICERLRYSQEYVSFNGEILELCNPECECSRFFDIRVECDTYDSPAAFLKSQFSACEHKKKILETALKNDHTVSRLSITEHSA